MKRFLSLLACGALVAGFASASNAQVNIDKIKMGTGNGNALTILTTALTSQTLTIPDPGGPANIILSLSGAGQTIAGGLTSSGLLTAGSGFTVSSGTITFTPLGTTGLLHAIGGVLSSGLLVNADVSGTAAIAGSKIDPNFVAQNILTTGTLGAGAITGTSIDGGTGLLQNTGDAQIGTGNTTTNDFGTGQSAVNTIGNTTGPRVPTIYGTTDLTGPVNFTTPPTFSSLTQGSTLFAGAGGAITQDNANYFWDETSKRLGIGTATPSVTVGSNAVGITVSNDDNDVSGDAHQITIQSSTAPSKELEFGLNTNAGQGSVQAYNQGTGPLPLALQPAGGDVGIGTGLTAPTHTLEVVGTTNISGAASIGGALGVTGLTSTNGGLTNTGAFTTSGGAASINDNSSLATTINTGTSTGAVHIGDGTGANSVSIGNTAGTVAIAASHWSVTSLGAASFSAITSSGSVVGSSADLSVANTGTGGNVWGEFINVTGADAGNFKSGLSINVSNTASTNYGLTLGVSGGTSNIDISGTSNSWNVTSGGAATFASLSLTSPLAVAQGGTGQTSFTTGAILVGASPIGSVADVGTGEVLTSGGTGANPSYSASPTLSNLTLNPATATTGLTINTTGTAGAISLTGAGSGNDVSAVNWSVTHAGAATFAGVNAGAGTLQNTGNAQIGTGASTTNDFGTGTSDVNTIGTSTSPVSTTHILGTVDINGTAVVNGSGTTGTIPKWTAGSTLGNSLLTDNGTTLSYTGTGGGAFGPLTSTGNTTLATTGATTNSFGTGTGNTFAVSNTIGSSDAGSLTTINGPVTLGAMGTGIIHSTGGVLSSSAVGLASADVTGTLAVANGGTNGTATPTAGAVAYGTGTAYGFTAAGTTGELLTSATAGTPTWTAQSAITAGNATNAANIGTTLQTTSASTFYPTFVPSNTTSTGQAADVATGLSYVPTTNTLSATTFSGALSGNATSASTVGTTATSTSGTDYLLFVTSSANSNQGVQLNSSVSVNPNTATITATTFSGNLTGTASNATSVNGVSYPATPGTNTVPVVTSSNTVTYETLPVNAGGTGATTFTSNGVLYGNGTSALGVTAASTVAGSFLQTTTIGSAPTWASTLAVANGGTGSATQNFVDLTTAQSVGGAKTFTALLTGSLGLTVTGAGTSISGGTINLNNDATANGTNINGSTNTGAVNIAAGTTGGNVVTIGNVAGATSIAERVGTGNYSLNGVGASTYAVGASTTTGTITIGGTAQTGLLTVGSSSGTNTEDIGTGAGATTLNLATGTGGNTVHIADGAGANTVTIANAASVNTVTLGSTNTTSTTTINSGSGAVNVNASNSQPTNINTGNSTGAVHIADGTGANSVSIGNTNTTGVTFNSAGAVTEATGAHVFSYASSLGAATYTTPNNVSVVDATGATTTVNGPAVAVNGQILYVHNATGGTLAGIGAIPTLTTWGFVYSGGAWQYIQ